MARLSKAELKREQSFTFEEQEVELPEIGGSVLVRAPSVKQRDLLSENAPDDEKDWSLENTAFLFSIVVVDPLLSEDEALEIISPWPGTALDKVLEAFTELAGNADSGKEAKRDAVGDFPPKGSE